MELNQLRCFLTVAQTQSITKAAEMLYITQSALSRIILRLEADLDVRLFDRKGNKIVLNENGKLFQSYIAKGLDSIDSGIAALSGEARHRRPAIAIKSELVADILSPVCDSLQVLFPQIAFTVCRCFDDLTYPRDELTEPDLLISPQPSVKGMAVAGRFSLPWYMIIGKNHKLAAQKLSLGDLRQQLFVFYGSEYDLAFVRSILCSEDSGPDIVVVENRRRSAALINRGIGIAFVPVIIARENSALSNSAIPYATIPISDINFQQDIFLHTRRGFPKNTDEERILEQLQAHLLVEIRPLDAEPDMDASSEKTRP